MIFSDSESTDSDLNSPVDHGIPEYSPISEGVEDDSNKYNLEGNAGNDEMGGLEHVADIDETINQQPSQSAEERPQTNAPIGIVSTLPSMTPTMSPQAISALNQSNPLEY